jgi:predicted RNA binding protein YcfA (HicA-like mRNA interferase family)
VTKLPRITGKQTVKVLAKAGFEHIRTRGSHYYLYHRAKDIVVSVPVHAGKTLAPKTLKAILRYAKITTKEFQSFT